MIDSLEHLEEDTFDTLLNRIKGILSKDSADSGESENPAISKVEAIFSKYTNYKNQKKLTFVEQFNLINSLPEDSDENLLDKARQMANFGNVVSVYYYSGDNEEIVWEDKVVAPPSTPLKSTGTDVPPPPPPPPPPNGPPPPFTGKAPAVAPSQASEKGKLQLQVKKLSSQITSNKLQDIGSVVITLNNARRDFEVSRINKALYKEKIKQYNDKKNLEERDLDNLNKMPFMSMVNVLDGLLVAIMVKEIDINKAQELYNYCKNAVEHNQDLANLLQEKIKFPTDPVEYNIVKAILDKKTTCEAEHKKATSDQSQKLLVNINKDLYDKLVKIDVELKKIEYALLLYEDQKSIKDSLIDKQKILEKTKTFLSDQITGVCNLYMEQIYELKMNYAHVNQEKQHYAALGVLATSKLKQASKSEQPLSGEDIQDKLQKAIHKLREEFFKTQLDKESSLSQIIKKHKDIGGIFKTSLPLGKYKEFMLNVKNYFNDTTLTDQEARILGIASKKNELQHGLDKLGQEDLDELKKIIHKIENEGSEEDCLASLSSPKEKEFYKQHKGLIQLYQDESLKKIFTSEEESVLSKAERKSALKEILTKKDLAILNDQNIADPEYCTFVEKLILEIGVQKIKAINLNIIEEELLGGFRLFEFKEKPKKAGAANSKLEIEINLKKIPEVEQAYYKIDKAILSYEQNKSFLEQLQKMLESNKFITDFFTVEEMKLINSLVAVAELKTINNSTDLDYDDQENNKKLLNSLIDFFSKTPVTLSSIINSDDHRKICPICMLTDQINKGKATKDFRSFLADNIPYELKSLDSGIVSARQYSKNKKNPTKDIKTPAQAKSGAGNNAAVAAAEARAKAAEEEAKLLRQKVALLEEQLGKSKMFSIPNAANSASKAAVSKPTIGMQGASAITFSFKDAVRLLEKESTPTISKTVIDPNFQATFEGFRVAQERTIQTNRDLFNSIDNKETLEAISKDQDKVNELYVYHNLSIHKTTDTAIKFMAVLPEQDQPIDLVNVSYNKQSVNERIIKNIVEINAAQQPDPNGELDDKACLVMVLSARDLAKKTKKFAIDNCEHIPATAIKLFLFGKILGLTPTINEETKKAIEDYNPNQELFISLKKCYQEVTANPGIDSKTILEVFAKHY